VSGFPTLKNSHESVFRMASTLEDAGRLYAWLDDAVAGRCVPSEVLARVHVVLEEAVVNATLHGFAPGAGGEITVRMSLAPDAISLTVEDNGKPFDPTRASPRARSQSLVDVVPGGWGLELIHGFCPSAAYERRGQTNRLTLGFALGAGGKPGE
jgi:serine/threonine-protein kinase RsbW